MRRLKERLGKEGKDAREQGHLDIALENDEQLEQIGEMWKILEELNGAIIPVEDKQDEL